MSDKFYNSGAFWGGCGLYYVILWVVNFFPAFIVAFALQRMLFGIDDDAGADVFCIVAMIIGTFVILGLQAARQWFIVLMLYLLTAPFFLRILYHLWSCESGQEYPLPIW